ncbi:hypothetical protein [Desulfitobacterium sp.]|uniref:hypothetical protein n=1 Tax=Desulfitobacterium sp. TaxID=49981 RepID=UPI002B206A9C|nr:hypothetical protein [Desulfitobacterium sp.]MEA4901583.1 hypothetical protein [Desulfitobacterium sp.]
MKTKFGIYYISGLSPAASVIAHHIMANFPLLEAHLAGPLEVPLTAWDSYRGQYDIHFLLENLVIPDDYDFIIWLINGDIGDSWHPYLFGAAGYKKAVVSNARLGTIEELAKEACHEIGHLVGLKHCCRHDCLMHTSWTEKEVRNKLFGLCEKCRQSMIKEHDALKNVL